MDQCHEDQSGEERDLWLTILCSDEEVVKVFSNHVIWYEIGGYLSYDDLKECRAVCRVFNKMVMTATNFTARGYIDLTQFAGGNIQEIPNFTSWKHLKLDAAKLTPLMSTHMMRRINKVGELVMFKRVEPEWNGLKKMIEKAESLNIYSSQRRVGIISRQLATKLVLSGMSLKTLILDPSLIKVSGEDDGQCFPLSPKLEKIEFNSAAADVFEDESETMADMLWVIAKAVGQTKLSSIVRIESPAPARIRDSQRPGFGYVGAIVSLIKPQMRNLERLEVNDPVFWSQLTNTFISQVFPGLKSVAGLVDDDLVSSVTNFASFVRNNAALEYINIQLNHKFTFDLFDALGEESTKKLKKLSFHLHTGRSPHEQRWTALLDTQLEEFELTMKAWTGYFPLDCDGLHSIFRNLPATVKKIRIKAKSRLGMCCSLNLGFPNILSSNLTALELSNCGRIVTDHTVQFICKNLLSLRVLNLAKATRCTDHGFLGENGRNDSASIRNLKDLIHLKLKSCGTITDKTLINGVQYLRLKFLDVSKNPKVTAEGCRAVVSGSPGVVMIGPMEKNGRSSGVPSYRSATAVQGCSAHYISSV